MVLTETHCHTGEISQCAKVPAKEIPKLYRDAGYGAIIVTDHYNVWTLEALAKERPKQIESWLRGYRTVEEESNRIGLKVFLGMELALTSGPEDYLIYGVTESFLFRYPQLAEYGLGRAARIIRDEGMLLYQAHPFRERLRRAPKKYLDGVEVFNGNPRHDSHNDRALRYAEDNALLSVSGSDFHQYEDVGRGGIWLPEDVDDNGKLVRYLKTAVPERYAGIPAV